MDFKFTVPLTHKVLTHKLSTGVWHQKSCCNFALYTLVKQIRLERKYQNLYQKVPTSPLPEPNEDMQVIKILACIVSVVSAFKGSKRFCYVESITEIGLFPCSLLLAVIFSTSELPGFLMEMKNLSASDCDCLPDCDLMEFQYTVSTTDLM